MLAFIGCDALSPYYQNEYQFDMSGSLNLSRANRSLQSADFELSSFEKYEIEVVYVYIALFDTEGVPGMSAYDQRTLYNKTIGSGTKIDLVKENLSDKLPLTITHPLGNGIDKIYVGLGTTVTAKGYINNNGVIYRTCSNGTMTDDGATADAEEGVFAVDGFEIPAFSVDESNPPLEANVKGIYLLLAAGGKKHAGHKDLTFNDTSSKIDLKFPLEMGLVRNGNGVWTTGSLDWVTPFINGASLYEKYYLKRTTSTYYTDVLRILTDLDGNAIVGQLVCGNLATENNAAIFNGTNKMWYRTDDYVGLPAAQIDAEYAKWFKQNGDNTIYFKAGYTGGITSDSFQRATHNGTISVEETTIAYNCLRVE